MTRDDYKTYVSYIRYFTSLKASEYSNRRLVGAVSSKELMQDLDILTAYIQIFERYHLPIIVLGDVVISGNEIALSGSISSSLDVYQFSIGKIVSGEGIPDETIVTKVTDNVISLSNTVTSSNANEQYTIRENIVTIDEMRQISNHINRILNTSYNEDFYYTEFDLTEESETFATLPYLFGNDASILIGSNIYSSLSRGEFSGTDTSVLFNFTDEYPYFAYPATYSDLDSILDQEGDDVLLSGRFAKYTLTVTGPSEWDNTEIYKVYRTATITAIPGHTYNFKFS